MSPTAPLALRPRGELPMRYESRLNRGVRVDLQVRRDELLTTLARLDDRLLELSTARATLLDELARLRDRLWPRAEWCHGRRPPRDDLPPLPPTPERPLAGRSLRSTCLAIIRRHGCIRLDELHRLLHLYGYAIAGRTPVKALADAMGYEVRKGRLHRPSRGTYEVAPGPRPRPGRHGSVPLPLDPVLTDDPATWHR